MPLSPAGLGIVEAGVVGVLTVAYGVPLAEATAIALLDRVISVFSIIVFGSIVYAVSAKPRGEGLARPPRPAPRQRPRGSPPPPASTAAREPSPSRSPAGSRARIRGGRARVSEGTRQRSARDDRPGPHADSHRTRGGPHAQRVRGPARGTNG